MRESAAYVQSRSRFENPRAEVGADGAVDRHIRGHGHHPVLR